MVASKTSIVLAAIALNAASSYAAPTHYSSDLAARGLGDEDLQLVARFFDDEELEARDYEDEFEARDYEDEFEARDVEDEFEARDFEDEFEARDFEDEFEARDFDEEEDLFARDFDDDEYLFARDAAQPSTVPTNSTSSTPPAKLVDTTKPQNSTLDAVKAVNGTQLNSSPSGNSTKPGSAKPKQNNKKKTAPRPHRPHRHHAHHNGTHHAHHNGTHHGHHNGTHHAGPHHHKSKPKQQNANNATLTPSTKNSTAVTDTKSKIQKEPDFGSGPSTNGTSSLTVQPNQKAKRSFADFMENLVARNRHHRHHNNNNNKPKEQGEKKYKGEKKKSKDNSASSTNSTTPSNVTTSTTDTSTPVTARDIVARNRHHRHHNNNNNKPKEQGEKKYKGEKKKSKDNSASSTNSTTPSDVTTSTTTDTSTPVTARDMVILARSLGLDDDYFLEERSFEDDLYEY